MSKRNVSEAFEIVWDELTKAVGGSILSDKGIAAMEVIRANHPDLSPSAQYAAWAILNSFESSTCNCGQMDELFRAGEMNKDA